ncbi:CGNR zinc finger domain-containing protein [Actinoplanes sp. RD1]|uniref:CGNR zinc finger domain-containing protein n=1 Tax=Actinoplanes sp. RD1 TaxID=3064538 RepID=UPI00274281BE|nr:CGNR zinc finger domain-containing protein [Actinoplanes sp. RD1]
MDVGVQPVAELVALVNDWGTLPREVGARAAPARLGLGPGPGPVAVADRLHAVFAAPDDAERARLISDMLAETRVRPVAGAAAWAVDDPASALLASAALALREQLAADPGRLGVCADDRCADVYVDVSPGGHRRFCSTTCQTRSRVAAFRRRRRES